MQIRTMLLTTVFFSLVSSGALAQQAAPVQEVTPPPAVVQEPVQEQTKFLGDRHVERGVTCDKCHGATPSDTLPIDDQHHQPCVQCHGFYDVVVKRTQPADPEEMNPHSQHDGNLPCTTCHKGHTQGFNYCSKCHFYTFKVP